MQMGLVEIARTVSNEKFGLELAFPERLIYISVYLKVSFVIGVQLTVVFMRPTLTSKQTIAMSLAGMIVKSIVSDSSFSCNSLLHLLLRAIAST